MKYVAILLSMLVFSLSAKAETTIGASYCQMTISALGIVRILDPAINTAGLHLRTFMVNSSSGGGFSLGVGPNSTSLKYILASAIGGQGNFDGDLYIPAGNGLYASISNTSAPQYVYVSYDLIGRPIA